MSPARWWYAGIGSRETPPTVLRRMRTIAGRLEARGWGLHSGGAPGADTAFELGVSNPDAHARIFLPWRGFEAESRSRLGLRGGIVIGDDPRADAIARQFHPAYDRLGQGARKLMARNGYQVLGPTLDARVSCVVCWTRDGGPSGGTGQALRIADAFGIPVFNLHSSDAIDRLGEFVVGHEAGRQLSPR